MRIAQINKYGGPEAIEIVNREKPKAGPGQVLIKVYASSINPFDAAVIKGFMAKMTDSKLPMVIGSDMAGVVTEVGNGAGNFKVGNKVYGSANALSGATGAFAEFALVPAGNIAKMPKNLDFNQAAAVVLTGVSALQALLEYFKLQANQKILIHGGAGGIGAIAIQLAKHIGAYVAVTATGNGIDYVKKLGADQVIDYKNQKFEEILSDYDAVFDTVGGEIYTKSFKILKKGGIIVSMLEQDKENLAGQHEVTAISQFTKVNTGHLNILTKFIEDKVIKIHIYKIFSFDKIREAFQAKEKEEVIGKVVVEVV